MTKLRLGQIYYLNCLPIYHALEEGMIPLEVELVRNAPAKLNAMFLKGELDITPISSIEYARNMEDCIILPNLSITADGRVASVLLFSKIPPTELEGRKVCLTSSSATSVVLLKVLFEHYYHVNVIYETMPPDLDAMLEKGDAALLIGDDALLTNYMVRHNDSPKLCITDLGEVWKKFTGEKMIYALWVIRREYAEKKPEEVERISKLLCLSKQKGWEENLDSIINKAYKQTKLPKDILVNYFYTIKYEFDESCKRALLTFYDYAYKSGLIDDRVKLNVWGESFV